MRISDWSSDVCSSDLSHGRYKQQRATEVKGACQSRNKWFGILYSYKRRAGTHLLIKMRALLPSPPPYPAQRHRRSSSPPPPSDRSGHGRRARGRHWAPALVHPPYAAATRPVHESRWIHDACPDRRRRPPRLGGTDRSEEHTSELQSLMRISYAVFCLK